MQSMYLHLMQASLTTYVTLLVLVRPAIPATIAVLERLPIRFARAAQGRLVRMAAAFAKSKVPSVLVRCQILLRRGAAKKPIKRASLALGRPGAAGILIGPRAGRPGPRQILV